MNILLAFGWISLNCGPSLHRIFAGFAFGAVQVEQTTADQRMLDPVRAVQIPGEGSAALTAARLMVRQILAGARIVGLLHFVGDQAVLDKNFPRTAAGTVHAVRGTHDFVMRPAGAVGGFPLAILVGDDTVTVGESLLVLHPYKIRQSIEKVTHVFSTPV